MANNNQGLCAHSDRFRPTDPELIAYCLRPMIERGARNPNCRFCYEAYIYDDSPDDLTEKYESCENKWYFLTSRSHRQMRNLGTWKATAKDKMVCDDATQRVLGRKRCLAYFDENKLKTPWLMHEYTMNDPKIVTIGSRGHYKDKNKMANWVLYKIFKKEKNPNVNNNVEYQVQNIENNQEEAMEEDVQMVAPMRSMLVSNQQSDLYNVHAGYMQTFPTTSLSTSPHSFTMQTNLTQTTLQDPSRALGKQVQHSIGSSTCEYYYNQSWKSATQGFRISSGASSSSSTVMPHKEDVYSHGLADQMDTNPNLMTMQHIIASSQTSKNEILQQDVQRLKTSISLITID